MPANTTEIEKRLWDAADELRANSKLKSSEYSVPVLGLIFLRYADAKFAKAEEELKAQTTSGRRQVSKVDYQARFGKIYEYFLGKFAMSEGQKGGEFFTPTPIVKLIAEIIEPYHGLIFDPACGAPRGAIKQYLKGKEAIRKVSSMPQYC